MSKWEGTEVEPVKNEEPDAATAALLADEAKWHPEREDYGSGRIAREDARASAAQICPVCGLFITGKFWPDAQVPTAAENLAGHLTEAHNLKPYVTAHVCPHCGKIADPFCAGHEPGCGYSKKVTA